MALRFLFGMLCMASLCQVSEADGHLVSQAKWRVCKGYALTIKYITSTGTDYIASWAVKANGNKSIKSTLLDNWESDADLEKACDGLVSDGEVGEIYEMKAENAPGCSKCLRMAIYPADPPGWVSDTGSQKKWVCGAGKAPPKQDCPKEYTCADMKKAYKDSGCCGNPSATFVMPTDRRLAASPEVEDTSALLTRVRDALKQAKAAGPFAAHSLSQKLRTTIDAYQ
mmetsp:Transcript_131259/g.238727  ORF Transcript_131259/g.238727 Transcript_131259/m.238727 type:complete len:226 (-) Transcript_131259:73-750(-)